LHHRIPEGGRLAFTRDCHYQSCIVPETREWGWGGNIHCAILFVRIFETLFQRRVDGLKPASTCLWTVPRAQALLRGRAWVAQLCAKSVGAVRLRALPFFLVQQGCLRFGVSRCGLAAAVVGGGVRCFVGVNLSSSFVGKYRGRHKGGVSG